MSLPRLVHLHVPKSAGTSLRTAFARHYGGRAFLEFDETRYAGIDPGAYDFFSGNIGYQTAATLNGEIIGVFRHPVERFISVYHFWRQLHGQGLERSVNTNLAVKFPIGEFARLRDQQFLVEEFCDRMTWQVALGSRFHHRQIAREHGLNDDGVFRLAVANLDRFAVVGVQDDLPGFARTIMARYGIDLELEHLNATKVSVDRSELPFSVLRDIQTWAPMDLEFYERVRRRAAVHSR